ncbi:MAG: hypothetical protein VYC59_07315 [Chloroflexota bacterium]|nr:hypothetical protein [Chloroflexota bacterium]
MVDLTSDKLEVDANFEAVQELYLERGWTDGLPIVPPTIERVEAMLAATPRDPQEIIGEIPPNWGSATVEKLAINAVMAGCKPTYLPVVIAAVEAMCDPLFNLYAIQATTHPCAPLIIVNGPICDELGLHGGSGAYGPGWRSNATIGRSVRLAQLNVGGARPGVGDMSTQGAPSKYTYCVAENQEANPWEALHIERGFGAEQSTVTVLAGEPPHNINDHSGSSAEDILTIVAGAISITGANNAYTGGETLLALGPEHAATIADDGFGKREIREWLHQNARIPLERYTHATMMERFEKIPDGPVPMLVDPDLLMIIVLGGPGKHSSWVPTFGGSTHSATREIRTI